MPVTQIDARELDLQELFVQLKEILASRRGCDVTLEVLITNRPDIKKIRTFVSFSGCQTAVEDKDGYYLLRITGIPCCV